MQLLSSCDHYKKRPDFNSVFFIIMLEIWIQNINDWHFGCLTTVNYHYTEDMCIYIVKYNLVQNVNFHIPSAYLVSLPY